jgi:dTDP-glucose 4,6-dehydratase
MKTLLITGGAGFIGSHFVKMILAKYPKDRIINYDALTYAGNLERLKDIEKNQNYTFIKGDIRDQDKINSLFEHDGIDFVVNFAAETHVDRSIEEPDVFLRTNVMGTQVLLEASKKHWKINPNDKYCMTYRQGVKFVQISTDEVYGALEDKEKFVETMPLLPNSPYSASKASADLFVRAYHKTFGLPVNITRCSNNYGPGQYPEKLIPLMISHCLAGKELPLYGDGLQVRDWLYVKDHCLAIDRVLHQGLSGEIYNVGGNDEKTNLEMVRMIIRRLGKSEELIRFVKDRPGHDRRYAIDYSKITNHLDWRPVYSFEKGMEETLQWYINHQEEIS